MRPPAAAIVLVLAAGSASARCLEVRSADRVRCFSLPSPRFDLSWVHSVERTAWRDTYALEARRIVLIASEFSSGGAGLPDTLRAGETFESAGGRMRIRHRHLPIADLRIHLSPLSHHLLHVGHRDIDLNALFGDAVVSVRVQPGGTG